MKTNKKIFLSMAFLLIGILIVGNVLAFAVSSKYWEDNPLTINPGETKNGFIILQNMAGTESVSARVGILQGSDIVSLDNPDMIYEIPLGTTAQVNFTVSVPEDSPIGGLQNIVFDITTITSESQGPMTFGSGAQRLVPVLITEKPKTPTAVSPWLYYLIAGVILLVIIIFVISSSRKKQ
jgi:hypothetical protein